MVSVRRGCSTASAASFRGSGASARARRGLLLVLLLLGGETFAQDPTEVQTDPRPRPESGDASSVWNPLAWPSGLGDLYDRFHETVSGRLVSTVRALDSFFGDESLEEDPRIPQLRIRSAVTLRERGEVETKVRTKARIPLPRTSQRIQLLLSDSGDDTDEPLAPAVGPSERSDSFAGIGFALGAGRQFFSALEVGGRVVPDFEPELRLRFRGERRWGSWRIDGTETVQWNEEDEFTQVTKIRGEHSLSEVSFIRPSTRLEWGETTRGVEVDQSLGYSRALGPQWGMRTEIGGSAHTRPSTIIDEWWSVLRLRHQLEGRDIFFEFAPGATYPRSRGYEFTPSLEVSVEILFGGRPTVGPPADPAGGGAP